MTSPAMSSDLQGRSLRALNSQEVLVGETLLSDAWGILCVRVGGLFSRVTAEPIDTALVSLVVQIQCAMVLRVLNNPDGKLEEAGDDYRYRLDATRSSGDLYASDAEVSLLQANDAISDGAFTIKPAGRRYGSGEWSDPTTWVPAT